MHWLGSLLNKLSDYQFKHPVQAGIKEGEGLYIAEDINSRKEQAFLDEMKSESFSSPSNEEFVNSLVHIVFQKFWLIDESLIKDDRMLAGIIHKYRNLFKGKVLIRLGFQNGGMRYIKRSLNISGGKDEIQKLTSVETAREVTSIIPLIELKDFYLAENQNEKYEYATNLLEEVLENVKSQKIKISEFSPLGQDNLIDTLFNIKAFLWAKPGSLPENISRLTELSYENPESSWNDLCKKMYGQEKQGAAFRKTKERTLEHVTNMLWYIDEQQSPVNANFSNMIVFYRTMFAGEVLWHYNLPGYAWHCYNEANSIAHERKWQTEALTSLMKAKQCQTSMKGCENAAYDKISVEELTTMIKEEEHLFSLYFKAILPYTRKGVLMKSEADQLSSIVAEAEAIYQSENKKSLRASDTYLQIKVLECETNNDFQSSMEYIRKGMDLYDQYNGQFPVQKGTYCLMGINAALHLRKSEEGKRFFHEGKKLFNFRSKNLKTLYNYGFLLALHCDDLQMAMELMEVIKKNTGVFWTVTKEQEKWELHQGFLACCLMNLKNRGYELSSKEEAFIEQVENNDDLKERCRLLYLDKECGSIGLNVFYFWYLYEKGDRFTLTGMVERYKTFKSRYLQNSSSLQRSSCFFSVMNRLMNYEDPIEALEKAKPFMKKLETELSQIVHTGISNEIVPYDLICKKIRKKISGETVEE